MLFYNGFGLKDIRLCIFFFLSKVAKRAKKKKRLEEGYEFIGRFISFRMTMSNNIRFDGGFASIPQFMHRECALMSFHGWPFCDALFCKLFSTGSCDPAISFSSFPIFCHFIYFLRLHRVWTPLHNNFVTVVNFARMVTWRAPSPPIDVSLQPLKKTSFLSNSFSCLKWFWFLTYFIHSTWCAVYFKKWIH